jgi:lysophospholipase L1-like esterase
MDSNGHVWLRKSLFRAGAILLGILPFIAIELGLRLLGLGRPIDASASLSGFNRNIPLFERQATVYRTALSRQPFFSAQEFAAAKPTNSFRIFCFGGSTVYGHPYLSDTAFPKWLEMELAGADPAHHYEAINCGGVSYASYRLAPLVKEVLAYQPDLIIVMTGENEFLEDRTYEAIKTRSAACAWLEDAVHSLRILNVARRWIHGRQNSLSNRADVNSAAKLSPQIKTRLDDRSGYASYHRDDAWHNRVASQFEESIRTMVADCRVARVPIVLVKPGANLRDCPPFKSEHRPNLSPEEERSWQAAFDAASKLDEAAKPYEKLASAKELYQKAEKIDGEYALLGWRLARLLDRLGKKSEALQYYLRARDSDVCPLRAPTRHEQILERIAGDTKTPLVDTPKLLAAKSPDGIAGNDWYLDHVHPTIGGHQKIARAISAQVREMGLVHSSVNWSDIERRAAYSRHLKVLGPNYLTDGQRRVEWLENWARRERLLDETLPKDTRGFLHAGFRRLDFGDEDGAWDSFDEALKRDASAANEIKEHAEELRAEGRDEDADELLRHLGVKGPNSKNQAPDKLKHQPHN